ncbi:MULTISPECIES: hypothetical protein [Bacillus]|uniref:Uncharacterized protein n=1 Tax=Bacillus cereus TaxID=1396 RepID=A0A9X6GF90_BACCE|nr:hypothetical protein [Bacillus cereus]OOR74383.1 hypothetical protein BLX06_14455 [Bacillus cereus]
MKTFVKPSMVNCGKSESVIKGDCSWGKENFALDETGAYYTKKRKYVHAGWLPRYKEVFKCAVVDGCSSDSNQC